MLKDYIIDLLLQDSVYDVKNDGTIWASLPLSGPANPKKVYPFRQMDRLNGRGRFIVTYRMQNQHIFDNYYLLSHRIVYRKFKGLLKPNLQINHIDGNPKNNHPDNLEQITSSENVKHAILTNLIPKGENSSSSILTENEVIHIKKLLTEGMSDIKIAKLYNVHRTTIYNIRMNRSWKHI